MFTFCLFMFWLHTVVLSKTRKLQFTNRVNLSSLFILRRHYLHILTAFYPFHKSLADIIILWLLKLGIKLLIHNKDDIQFVTEFPCFLGTHCRCRYKKKIVKLTKNTIRSMMFVSCHNPGVLRYHFKQDILEFLQKTV